jgi:hypothetical protein
MEWYRRNYPEATEHDERCLRTLLSLAPIYRLPITGQRRKDGGIRACGEGIEVHLPAGQSFSTYDDDSLTRLVIAAHRFRCRVDISHRGSIGVLMIHPRQDAGYWHERHPGVADLIGQLETLAEKDGPILREPSAIAVSPEQKKA